MRHAVRHMLRGRCTIFFFRRSSLKGLSLYKIHGSGITKTIILQVKNGVC